jgi:hypothetical protein
MADKIFSQDSGVAPYETFFHDFDFEAYSFFNFWTADEASNDTLTLQENEDINNMPRFVKLVWRQAPDLPEEKDAYDKISPPSLNRSSQGPLMHGNKQQFIVEGIKYSPDQLSPKQFSEVSTALANSDIAPGVIKSVVSLPLVSAGITRLPPPYRVDLDTWYSNDESRGKSISNVRNTFNNRSSGIFNLVKHYKSGVSAKNAASFNEMFSGQFSATPSSFVNRKSVISSANPNSPALSLRSNPAITTRIRPAEPAESIFNQITYNRNPRKTNSINVSFVDSSIAGAVSHQRLNVADDAAHVNSISAVAQVLKNLVTYAASGLQNVKRKITLKSFEAPNGVSTKQYVGYLIEKYEQLDGVFVLKELIGIGDPYMDEFYDTKVRYGGVYRYRIRSVMRWVRPKNVGVTGTDNSSNSIVAWNSNEPHLNSSNISLTPNFASYFGSEWSKNWATAHIIDDEAPNPPDQLTVLPQSEKKRIVVTFQIPDNSQRDIWQMTLYRKTIDKNGRDVEQWSELADFDMTRPGYYEDYDVSFVPNGENAPISYVYAATAWSVHNGESKLSEQISARLNSDWNNRGEYSVDFISSRGVDRESDHGVFSTIPTKMHKTHIVVAPLNAYNSRDAAKVTVSGQERWGNRMLTGNGYIIRLHSLDTGETHDIDFSTSMTNVEKQKVDAPSNVYVPSANEQYVYDDQALTSG